MCFRNTILMTTLCCVMVLSCVAGAETISIYIKATADEPGDEGPDVFGVYFACSHNVKITKLIYDLTFANANLYFDVVPHLGGAYDFRVFPNAEQPTLISSPVGASALRADNSPQLVINFTNFDPGEILYFGIDVDGYTSPTFDATDFAGAKLGVALDPSLAFPGADPIGLVMTFVNDGGLLYAVFQSTLTTVPEPSTCVLLGGGVLMLGCLRRRWCRRRT